MLENKNIDRFFQENLKDLEIYPRERVWKNIENQLQGKPQRKTIALWQKLSGVAIIFVLMFSVGFGYFKLNKRSNINKNTFNNSQKNNSIVNNTPKNNTPVISLTGNKEKTTEVTKNIVQTTKTIKVKQENTNKNLIFLTEKEDDIAMVAKKEKGDKLKEPKITNDKVDINDEFLAQSEITEIQVKDKNDKKWSIGPSISPVYYNSLQKGSAISSDLKNNRTTADEALSYGIKVDYQLNKKFKIQSGVNKVELAYNTKDVNTTITSSKSPNHNINTKNSGILISPSKTTYSNTLDPSNLNKSTIEGDLNQSIEYVEVPLEMKYNILQSRVGLNVVGGFSTFILTNNQVSMISSSSTVKLGEANNLNNFNFSGNLGFDLDYKINKDWFLNLTPMVKYQFNTFSNNAGNFQPYYFGVYSGVNYRF